MNAAMTTEYSLGGRWLAPLWRFLSRFVRDTNPTLDWKREPGLEFVLNLDDVTFAHISLGVQYKECRRFGPCGEFLVMEGAIHCDEEGREIARDFTRSYSFEYAKDGFGFSTDENWRVDGFHITLLPDPDATEAQSYSGKLIFNHEAIRPEEVSCAESVARLFGQPDVDVDNSAVKIEKFGLKEGDRPYCRYLHYRLENATLSMSLDKSSRVEWISLSAAWPEATCFEQQEKEVS